MRARERGSATLIVIILLSGLVFAVTNLLVLMMTAKGRIEVPLAEELYRVCPPCLIYFALAPLLVATLTALMAGPLVRAAKTRRDGISDTAAAAAQATDKPAEPDPAAALQLLALLQQEGRLIDFLEEDITQYDDAQVGAAVRAIHAGCRKALRERVQLERVYAQEDGTTVSVEPGFDPATVRLTGNVTGAPPFRGTLQHSGWRVTKVDLPRATTAVSPIIAPAEVEIS